MTARRGQSLTASSCSLWSSRRQCGPRLLTGFPLRSSAVSEASPASARLGTAPNSFLQRSTINTAGVAGAKALSTNVQDFRFLPADVELGEAGEVAEGGGCDVGEPATGEVESAEAGDRVKLGGTEPGQQVVGQVETGQLAGPAERHRHIGQLQKSGTFCFYKIMKSVLDLLVSPLHHLVGV